MAAQARTIPSVPLVHGMSALSRALNGESSLIDFSDGGILDLPLLRKLCTALQHNETVTHLNFSNNMVGDEGCEVLGTLLMSNPFIIALNLSNCGMSDLGACCVLRCSRKLNKLQSINFSRNKVGDGTMYELDRVVGSTNCLSELILNDTNISFTAAVKLLETMISNYTLLYCTLPFRVGCALLDEVKLILTRNWKRMTKLEGGLSTIATVRETFKHEDVVLNSQWKPQNKEEQRVASVRAKTFAPSVADWQQPCLHESLLCLTVLDRKTRKISFEEDNHCRSSNSSTPRVSPRRHQSSPRSARAQSGR